MLFKKIVLKIILWYQQYLSLDQGWLRKVVLGPESTLYVCRFQPTCSMYMYEAIEKYGVFKGGFLGLKRLVRCNPFNKGGFDPIP